VSATSFVERASSVMESLISRRSFITRSAMVGSAVAAGAGLDLALRPITAYGAICSCHGTPCTCGSTCCSGFSEFCCSVNGGFNACPTGSIIGGWWKADNSAFCNGPRYYMDCNATCSCDSGCGGGFPFCDAGCDGTTCGCGSGSCDHWLTGCLQFRYGQCNQEVPCMGRIVCRVVTCVPPWEIDPTCSTVVAVDDRTATHDAPCWSADDIPSLEEFMPVTVTWNNSAMVFAVGPDGYLRQRWQNLQSTQWASQVLATGLVANQTPGMDMHGNSLHLYAMRRDSTVVHVWQPAGQGFWGEEVLG
jgi:hypothetical protein